MRNTDVTLLPNWIRYIRIDVEEHERKVAAATETDDEGFPLLRCVEL